jgi:hypothetical protein
VLFISRGCDIMDIFVENFGAGLSELYYVLTIRVEC